MNRLALLVTLLALTASGCGSSESDGVMRSLIDKPIPNGHKTKDTKEEQKGKDEEKKES